MRQAGRSLPEYRAIRGTGNILDAIKDPELVAEITLQPVRRYDVDAAVLYSDIMVPLEAVGFGVEIVQGVGPVIAQPFEKESDLARLQPLDPITDAPYVLDAIKLLIKELNVPLIGFAGAPFTLAAYLIEGGPSKNYAKTKSFMHGNSQLWFKLVDRLADIVISSLTSQINAGCQAVQLFDSWAGTLSPADYKHFVMPASQKIFNAIAGFDVPKIHFGVVTGELLGLMSDAGADVVGVDWRVSLDEARKRVDGKALQGNLDPAICLAPWETVKEQADIVLSQAGRQGHVFNLGHGVLPETDPEILKRLVDHVHGTTTNG